MKKIILLLSLVVLIGCKSKKEAIPNNKPAEIVTEVLIEVTPEVPPEVKIEEAKLIKLAIFKVDANLKTKAYELGKRILMTCNTSKFKPFNESEATQSVIDNITEENLSKTCTNFRQRYGAFKDLKLMEIYIDNESKITIFRYKALYTKAVANKELRVYMNEQNQISAIKSMDWSPIFEKKLFIKTDSDTE
ncbi:hypothetical protein [Flavobacterium sp. ACAM 123]|jgi:hypothetical protein|uniref:hypothetical protein n=1 Tax=Flavobacterium sp. ACAM 123 TaxID=1189620 RepID=UPI0002E92672|nr:hypothetical protein [Flavobacterium sp. ACAM 123]